MAVLPIVTGADNPILRTKTKPVAKVTKELQKLFKDMEETTRAADGLGLAAPQIGLSHRVCLVRINGRFTPLVNPQITRRSAETEMAEEGCLSLPEIWVQVPRSISARVAISPRQRSDGCWATASSVPATSFAHVPIASSPSTCRS